VNDEQTRTNIHALGGIRTHGLSVKAMKAYASDGAANKTGIKAGLTYKSNNHYHHPHQRLCIPCKDLGRLTPEVP
jgi:hypothetical protein